MKRILTILSVVLFANQASADGFKNGDKFICINHQEITLSDDNIWPADPYMLVDKPIEITDCVLFVRTNALRSGAFPADAKILNYQGMTNYLLANGHGSTYGLMDFSNGVVRFGYAAVAGGRVTSGLSLIHI